MAITGLTLLQKLQKLFGVKNVSNMMGRTSNVQTLGQGTNNPFAATFSKKYLKENPDGIDEAATVILENMQFAFGNKNSRQMKNFESNVNTLYELRFAPAGPEAQVVDLGSKQPVTGKGLLSLKKDMGLPEGVDPNSPMGKMLSSTNRLNKMGKNMETNVGDLFMNLMKSSAPPVDRKKESLVRTAARQFLNREIKLNKIKLKPDEIKSIVSPSGGGTDPIDILRTYYGEDVLESFDGIANKFMNTEKYSDFNKIIDENLDPSFLRPRKDPSIKQSYTDDEMKDIVNKKEDAFKASKLRGNESFDELIDPTRIKGGISTKIKLNSFIENEQYAKDLIGGKSSEFNILKENDRKEILDLLDKEIKKGKTPPTSTDDMPFASGGLAGQLHMNEGGRVAYGKGGLTRRAFLKLMGGAAATGAALKTGLGGLIKTKGLSKIVTPTITKTAGMPDWFPALVKKAWTEGTDVTKKASVHTDGREVIKRVNIKGTDMDVAHNLKTGDVDVVIHGEYGTYNTADNPKTGGLSTAYGEGLEMYYKPASSKNKKPNFEINEAQAKFEGNPEAPDILTEGVYVDLNSTKADLKSLELYAKDKKPSFKDSYKIDKKNKETKKYMENPSDSPEIQNYPDYLEPDIDDFAIGGRVGFFKGGPAAKAFVQFLKDTLVKKKGYNKTLLDNVLNQKNGEKLLKELYEKEIGKVPLTTADKAPIPESTVTRDLFKDANERFNTNIKDRTSAEEVGIDNLFDKDGVLNKDAVLSDITKSVEKTKKSKIVKTKTPNKALLKAMDEVGGSASGDMKYDANILADEYAFQLG